MRGGLIAVLSLVACAGEKHDALSPAAAMPPMRAVSCGATHDAVGTACVPRFDTCGEGEIALVGNGCRPVGVPKDGCAPGFAHDGKGACEPILPKSCDKGLFARPGESTCHAVDDCGSDRYPIVTGAVFVDAAYAGTSDGTADRPYRTIAAALAAPSVSAIAIAAGRYEEDVVVDREVRIVGACSAKVEIVGAATGLDSAAITLRANAMLEHLSITGAGSGVFVDTATAVRIANLRVHDTVGVGVWVRRGSKGVTIADTLVEQASRYGVVVTGSSATIEQSVVRATRFESTGAGIQANPTAVDAPASIKIDRCVVEGNEGAGVATSGATMTVDASVIRDTRSHPDGTWGAGAISEVHPPSKLAGKLEISRSVVERSRYFGVVATASNASLDRVVVRDVEPEKKSGKLGRGVAATGPTTTLAELTIKDSTVLRTHETGIDSAGNVKLVVERSLVADVAAIDAAGSGVAAIRYDKTGVAPNVVLTDVAIVRPAIAGVLAYGELAIHGAHIDSSGAYGVLLRGADATIAGLVVARSGDRGILLRPDGSHEGNLTLTDVLVDKARTAGVGFGGHELHVDGLFVRGVDADSTGKGGVGLNVARSAPGLDPTATARNTAIERASGAGLYFSGATASVTSCTVRDTRALAGGFGDGLVAAGTVFVPSQPLPSIVTIGDSTFEKNARAGLAVFGSQVSLSASRVVCNALALNAEPVAAITPEGPVSAPVSLKDESGNLCGCENQATCQAQSAGLQASAPPSD